MFALQGYENGQAVVNALKKIWILRFQAVSKWQKHYVLSLLKDPDQSSPLREIHKTTKAPISLWMSLIKTTTTPVLY